MPFTPGEHAEAQAKMLAHERGREEAKLYRQFLDSLQDVVLKRLEASHQQTLEELMESGKTMGELGYEHASWDNALLQAGNEASQKLGKKSVDVMVEPSIFIDMTLGEFLDYIEKTKSALIQ